MVLVVSFSILEARQEYKNPLMRKTAVTMNLLVGWEKFYVGLGRFERNAQNGRLVIGWIFHTYFYTILS